jgi:integrase
MKNLTTAETRTGKWAAGATTDDQKSLIFEFAWWMKKQGYAESTIKGRVKLLRVMSKRGADLNDPETVKSVIAQQEKWSPARKEGAVLAYSTILKMTGKKWNPPFYKRVEKLPFIPLEQELDQLIAGCSQKISPFLQIMKETAIRAGEAFNLSWTDIDFGSGTVRVTPEKGSKPRIFKLSNKMLNMLAILKQNEKNIFGYGTLNSLRRTFERQRKTLAHKLGNPRLLQITFHTFRHWKATMLYHKTKDVLYVMNFLGHKSIKNTLVYIQLEEALFNQENEEFICKAAKTISEAKSIIELGFEYVCEIDDTKLFRKRK